MSSNLGSSWKQAGGYARTPIGNYARFPYLVGITGYLGITGSQGHTGATGAQGSQGAFGASVVGATGVQGATGAQGSTGFQGTTGTQGFQGATGETGTQGFQGDTGATGAQGFQNAIGETGATGFQGTIGETGAQGFQGDNGETGAQGFQNAIGETGAQGFQGDTGATGAQGFQGAIGETGAQGNTGIAGSGKTVVATFNISIINPTLTNRSLVATSNYSISDNNIFARLDSAPVIQQQYTFGSYIQPKWVAVGVNPGNDGIILVSTNDGNTWTNVTTLNNTLVSNVSWNGQIWVACSISGLLYSSNNANTWTFSNVNGGSFNFRSAAWNGNKWIACGQSFSIGTFRTVISSTDGITWSNTIPISDIGQGRGIAWNGTMWVIVGAGFSFNTIFYSTDDGMNWTGTGSSIFSGGNGLGNDVAWNGSMWVAVGQSSPSGTGNSIAYSNDGITWIGLGTSTFSKYAIKVGWNGSIWVAVGENTNTSSPIIAYSYNGINWTGVPQTLAPSGMSNISANSVAWNGTKWIVNIYALSTTNITYFASSYDGINWTYQTDASIEIAYGIAYNSARPNTITFTPSGGTTPGITGDIVTTPISLNSGDVLDVVSDKYYNQGFLNFAVSIITD
jgi:hypothetical protein